MVAPPPQQNAPPNQISYPKKSPKPGGGVLQKNLEYRADPTRVGFENENVRIWMGLVFDTAYIVDQFCQKWAFKVIIYGKFRMRRLKMVYKWVGPQKLRTWLG